MKKGREETYLQRRDKTGFFPGGKKMCRGVLKKVTLHWKEGGTTEYLVFDRDLAKFIKATLELHHCPGINPHTGKKTAKVIKITSRSLVSLGRFWWSTPGLKENDDPNGAEIWDWSSPEEILWSE